MRAVGQHIHNPTKEKKKVVMKMEDFLD